MITNHSLIAIRLFYAAYFAAMGLILPYFPVFLSNRGFNTLWVGIFVGVLTAAKVIAPPLAGLILERKHTNTRTFLCLTSLLATIAAASLIFVLDIRLMLTAVLCFGLFWAAILPLTDGISLIVAEVSLTSYGRLRVWGSVGFVLTSLAGGWWLVDSNIYLLPWSLTGLLLLTTLAAIGFPDLRTLYQHTPQQSGPSHTNQHALRWLLFIGFCMQASHGAYYGFFSLYMLEQGYSGAEVGFFWVLGVLAEILLMWFWSKPIQQASPALIFSLCLCLAGLRWCGMAITSDFYATIALQLLHAASFAAFHLSAVAWVRHFAVKEQQTSAQGWYSSLGFGLGSTIGIILCGYIVENYSYSAAFYTCTFITFLGLLAVLKLKAQMRGTV